MLSLRLYVRGDTLGALNLYASEPDAFTSDSEHIGALFAAHAAVAMSDAQRVQQLQIAADVRDLIGQAKGILMERYKLTAVQAFELLVRASQTTNTRLADIARHLADTGELPVRKEVWGSRVSDPRRWVGRVLTGRSRRRHTWTHALWSSPRWAAIRTPPSGYGVR
jgi:hypothetical protein